MEYWVIPCNTRFFDIVDHFSKNTKVVWKNDSSISEGDCVFLYLGAPLSQIKYKCKVLDVDVCEEILTQNQYAIRGNDKYKKRQKYMMLEMEKEFKDGVYTFSELKSEGLGQVQKQARVDRRLKAYLTLEGAI